MVLGAKGAAGRVAADRVIIGAPCGAANPTDEVKLTAAVQTKKNVRFVFIDIWDF